MNYWESETMTIRAIEADDYDIFYEILKDESIQRNEADIRFPMSLEACKAFALEQSLKGNDYDYPVLILVEKRGKKIGMITPSMIDKRVGIFTAGIGILPSFQKMGYATEALRMILKFYFEEMRCVKFEAGVYQYNIASNKLCEKTGLSVEGTRRKAVFTNGRYYNEIQYGLTDDEYVSLYG